MVRAFKGKALAIAGQVGLAFTWLAAPLSAETAPLGGLQPAVAPYKRVLVKESASRVLCESRTDRVFVAHKLGTECIAYFVTKGHETDRRAVVFLDGDLKPEKMADDIQAKILSAQQIHLQRLADTMGVRFVAISRPGILGSSGNHAERRKPAEMLSVDAAIDLLKTRLGIDSLAVVGQSGGSTIAAALMTLGRKDIACAVLGSGNLAVVDRHMDRANQEGRKLSREAIARTFYDPLAHVSGIAADPARRIFVLGDPKDQVTPFDLQQRFADSVRAQGHHVAVVPIMATGTESHGSIHRALPAGAQCITGRPETYIVARASLPIAPAPVASAPAVPTAPASGTAASASGPVPQAKPARRPKEELSI